MGGADPDGNPRLRTAIVKARGVSMPKDNIERAIKKGVGGLDGVDYTEKSYEGYGPAGVAVMVECLTDNINRTVSEVRLLSISLAVTWVLTDSVSWMFHKKGTIVYEKSKVTDYDALFETALDNGADDVNEEGEV